MLCKSIVARACDRSQDISTDHTRAINQELMGTEKV
jgi:hypothetical protein